MLEVEFDRDVEIVVNNNIEVTTSNTNVTIVEDTNDIEVTVNRQEYVITGDEIYIPKRFEDAPTWMQNLITQVVDTSIGAQIQDLNEISQSLESMIDAMEVAKNTYEMSIISSNDIDQRINTAVTTLNSNMQDADSTILEVAQTRVTPEEASAITIDVISAQLGSTTAGTIGATVSELQTAIANEEEARSTSIEILTSSIEGAFDANATAMNYLNTYVGVTEIGEKSGTGLLADVEILQKQNDGVIETTTGIYDVMINPENPNLAQLVATSEPYATWRALDNTGISNRLAHIGDVYVKYSDTANGAKEYIASYKFIRTVVDETSPYATDAEGFTWALIIDQAAQDAYEQALNAYDLADNKRRVFTVTPSGPYDEGDLWVKVVSGSNQIWKCQITREQLGYYNAADWSIASTDDTATTLLQTGLANGTTTVKLTNAYVGTTPFLTYITNEIDSKVGVYSGETAPVAGLPVGVAINDIYLWFTTDSKKFANGTTQVYDITRTYKYSGSAWNEITTDSNITALADLADGKRTVFSGNTVPVGAVNRDVWIPSATNGVYIKGEIYQYNGTSWIIATKYSADIESVRENLQGQIDGKVDTYYQGTVPAGMTALNNGDYWYCTADISTYKKGKVYKYAHATTSWVETADVSRYAFDTADGKASIFTSTAQPTAYKINDMLIVTGSFNNGTTTFSDGVVLSSNATRTAGFVAADWVKKINDTEDLDLFVSSVYNPAVLGLQSQIDGKIENWFTLSTNDPKVSWVDADTKLKHNGDLWYQTDTKISYYYTSSTHTWNILDDAKAIQALSDAATAQTAANNAQTSANNAQTSANTANSLLADIASDSKFTPSEKSLVKNEWDSIQSEYTKNLAQGTSYSVSTTAYTTAYNALNTYITPLLASLTTTSDIVGTTFRATFKAYYDANVDLLNAISNKINLIADGKITSYYMATFSAVQAMSTAWTASEKTSNIGDLAVVYNDTTVDNNGTWRWDGANWVTTRDKKLVALASQVTALSTDLQSGDGTWADADSTLTNSLTTTINDKTAAVESKFAYNSVIGINGIYKKSGFGLTTNYVSGSGTEVDPYVSEFWIDASRFKFTNSNVTGSVSPFTIDATGTVPEITFNGKVSFNNVTNVPDYAPKINMVPEKYSTFSGIALPPLSFTNCNIERRTDLSYIKYGNASLMTWTTANDAYVYLGESSSDYNVSVPIGASIIISVYVKPAWTEVPVELFIRDSSGAHYNTSARVPAGVWTRVSFTHIATTSSLVVRVDNNSWSELGTQSPMAIDGVMVELNESNGVPSPFVAGHSSNNDIFAQKIGYLSYADMVTAATNGKTIINGGYLRGELIEANSINAAQIDTVGLVAENISSNTIDGKTITGGLIEGTIINGVVITGATIRASYLDLDGELEVLTNFYLCVSGDTTGVPALAISEGRYRTYNIADIDAIPSSGYANIYRIPSISMVKEPSTNFSTGTTYGTLRSYNTANAGHNMKAVKRRPTFQNLSGIHIATGDVILKLGNITLGTFSGGGSNPTSSRYFHDFEFSSPYTSGYANRIVVGDGEGILYQDEVYLYNVPVFCDLRVERYIYGTVIDELYHWGEIKVYMAGGSHTLPFDWEDTADVITITTAATSSSARISGIQINNMI